MFDVKSYKLLSIALHCIGSRLSVRETTENKEEKTWEEKHIRETEKMALKTYTQNPNKIDAIDDSAYN